MASGFSAFLLVQHCLHLYALGLEGKKVPSVQEDGTSGIVSILSPLARPVLFCHCYNWRVCKGILYFKSERGWEDRAGSKVLATQAQGPEFNPKNPYEKYSYGGIIVMPVLRRWRQAYLGGFLASCRQWVILIAFMCTLCGWVGGWGGVHVCLGVCGGQRPISDVFLSLPLFFWDKVFFWLWCSLIWLDWLTSELQGPPVCLPSAGVTNKSSHIQFLCEWWGSEFSPYLVL